MGSKLSQPLRIAWEARPRRVLNASEIAAPAGEMGHPQGNPSANGHHEKPAWPTPAGSGIATLGFARHGHLPLPCPSPRHAHCLERRGILFPPSENLLLPQHQLGGASAPSRQATKSSLSQHYKGGEPGSVFTAGGRSLPAQVVRLLLAITVRTLRLKPTRL